MAPARKSNSAAPRSPIPKANTPSARSPPWITLVELLGADASKTCFLISASDYWRLRDHCRALASTLVKGMPARGNRRTFRLSPPRIPQTKAGIPRSARHSRNPTPDSTLAKEAMKHESSVVRAAALNAYASLGGDAVTDDILTHLTPPPTTRNATPAKMPCSPASRRSRRRRRPARPPPAAMTSDAARMLLDSLYYLIARIGDAKSIDVLRKAAATDDPASFNRVMLALSYSPSREADKVMLDIAAANPKRAQILGPHAVRRMVIGPKGYGDITSAQRMDFADAMLKLTLEPRIVKLLGNHPRSPRAAAPSCSVSKKASPPLPKASSPTPKAWTNSSPADSKIAAKALQDVIEYIEVTRLRGGVKAHMNKDDNYTEWKALQARAGKVLLKVHKPETAPIPGFDSLDLE